MFDGVQEIWAGGYERWRTIITPLSSQVEYEDGTEATISQCARDVSTFLQWCSEPEQDDRKKKGMQYVSNIAPHRNLTVFHAQHHMPPHMCSRNNTRLSHKHIQSHLPVATLSTAFCLAAAHCVSYPSTTTTQHLVAASTFAAPNKLTHDRFGITIAFITAMLGYQKRFHWVSLITLVISVCVCASTGNSTNPAKPVISNHPPNSPLSP
jgi:hypothetical protein